VIKTAFHLLYDKDEQILSLLAPAIPAKTKIPYGYIQGYPEYTRENGAQYNHAAMWFLEAAAKAKQNDMVETILEAINPITRSDTEQKANTYGVEPYVIAADIWKEKNHLSQGGWTWYTASSGLFYRVILEHVLGLRMQNGNELIVNPCIPKDWNEYEVVWRFGKTRYVIKVRNASKEGSHVHSCALNGKKISGTSIFLEDDGKEKEVVVTL
jgi:cellobiose phosphorylase